MELDKVDKITSAHHEKFDLEDRLVKLDKALHDILQSVKHRKVEDEMGSLKGLFNKKAGELLREARKKETILTFRIKLTSNGNRPYLQKNR